VEHYSGLVLLSVGTKRWFHIGIGRFFLLFSFFLPSFYYFVIIAFVVAVVVVVVVVLVFNISVLSLLSSFVFPPR